MLIARQALIILRIFFDSVKGTCCLPDKKIVKYTSRLACLRKNGSCSSKELEKLFGNLVFASWVMPYGRSFISHIAFFLDRENTSKKITLDAVGLTACDVWSILLKRNRGLSISFWEDCLY